MRLGTLLQIVRNINCMSERDLSQKMGTTKKYILRVESNEVNPTMEELHKFTQAFGMKEEIILNFLERTNKEYWDQQKVRLEIMKYYVGN